MRDASSMYDGQFIHIYSIESGYSKHESLRRREIPSVASVSIPRMRRVSSEPEKARGVATPTLAIC